MEVLSIGEPLMEFSEIESDEGKIYKSGFGGDTSNFIIAVARQGVKAGYQTKVGKDAFGDQFLNLWKKEGVDVSQVIQDPNAHTGIYFISYSNKGHQFTYLRKNSSASKLNPTDINSDIISNLKCLHISGISQAISTSSCDAIFRAVEIANKNRVPISFDPNLRLKLWSLTRARAIIHETVQKADYFLPSLEDAEQLTGISDPKDIIDYYLNLGAKNIILKLGPNGVMIANDNDHHHIEGIKVDTIDATGAGDTFDGVFISKILQGATMEEAAKYANIGAALSTRGYGAVTPIPMKKEIDDYVKGL